MNTNVRKISKYSTFEKKKFPFVYLLMAFPVLQFVIFWVYLNSSSLVLSFIDGEGRPTLENFKMIMYGFKDNLYGYNLFEALRRSLTLWGLDFFILFPIGVLTTYILYRRIAGHYLFRVCYIIPSLMGAVIWTKIMRYMSQPVSNGGVFIQFLQALGVKLPINAVRQGLLGSEETAFPTLITIKIVMGLVGNNAVLTGAFSRIPEEFYEASYLDGADFWTVFFKIAVPCVWSTIATLMTFSLCSIMTADYAVFLYSNETGKPGMSTIGFLLYKITYDISQGGGNPYYGYPAALGMTLTLITLPIVLGGRRIIEKVFSDVEV